jgi:BolA protein
MSTASKVETLLRERLLPLAPTRLELVDDSHLHAGHAGAREGGHYRLLVVAAAFAGRNTLARHRMVFGLVGGLKEAGIHALSVEARTPEEDAQEAAASAGTDA